MAVYAYQACAPNGAAIAGAGSASRRKAALGVLKGTIAADNPQHARELLRERRLDVIALRPIRQRFALDGLKRIGLARTQRHEGRLITLIRELSTLLAVGTPMLQSLDTVLGASRHDKQAFRSLGWLGSLGSQSAFNNILLGVRDRVAAGAALSEAMADHPQVFDELTRRLVEVGERTGTLDEVLDKLAGFKERSASFRGRLANAMIYPAIVLAMAVVVTLLLMTFVIPNILQPLIESGRPLPTITLIVKALSDTLLGWWWLIALIGAGLLVLAAAIVRSQLGQSLWHRWQLKIPGLGETIRKQETVRVALVVHTMIGSGVPFLQALNVAERTVRNRVFRKALSDCRSAVGTGSDIAEALRQTGAFPPTVVQVFALGQQSGRLEPMLERLAQDYDKQVQQSAQRLAVVLEPVMILVLAVLIGLIAFATILPVLEAGHVL